jgi:uncharacterized YccA/Bax inhibitor family protein
MANPILTDKAFAESRQGWAAPEASSRYGVPVTDGPISRYAGGVMTLNGTVTATAVLFAICLVAGVYGWNLVKVVDGRVNFPAWTIAAIFGALAISFLTSFKPKIARITGPLYAVIEGIVVGAISHLYDLQYKGIVLQAVLATGAVFAVMLVLFATRIIRVTEKMRRVVMTATLGLMAMYGISLIFSLFGHTPSFWSNASPLGILLSVAIAGLAAFHLLLNFDLIERNVQAGAPKYMEWYAAFGLFVTVVWLYLEMLRLLSKLQSRR